MKFTIVGGSGYIGTRLSAYLQQKGHYVYTPTRSQLLDLSKLGGQIIYCAGLTGDFRNRPFDTIEAHVSLFSSILKESKFESLLYLSSTRLYINSISTEEYSDININPKNEGDLYNISKLAGESIAINSNRQNVKIARLSNVVGPDEYKLDTYLGDIIKKAKNGIIKSDLSLKSEKDYIWIDDLLDLLYAISNKGKGKIYNVASGMNIQNASWISKLVDATGCGYQIASPASELVFPKIDIRRITREFDYRATRVLDRFPQILG